MQNMQDFFAKTMGIALQCFHYSEPLTKPSNFTPFCSKYTMANTEGRERCSKCLLKWTQRMAEEKTPLIFKCHTGLDNFGIPIIVKGQYVASVLGGKIFTSKPDEKHFINLAKELGIDEKKYLENVKKIRIIQPDKLETLAVSLYTIINSMAETIYEKFQLSKTKINPKDKKDITLEELLLLNCEEAKKPITTRDLEVLKLIVLGKNNTEIAQDLFITIQTVISHVSSILEKFGVEDRVQVAVKAVREGVV
mgnify:CR=1 FL=1